MRVMNKRNIYVVILYLDNLKNTNSDIRKIQHDNAIMIVKKYASKFLKKNIENINIIYSKSGKPFLKYNDLKFSISHSNQYVTVCFSKRNIGIDIEKVELGNEKILKKICNKKELKKINNLNMNLENLSTIIWTKKEAYIKSHDFGKRKIMKNLFNCNVFKKKSIETFKINNYYLSICHKQHNPLIILDFINSSSNINEKGKAYE